VELGTVGVTELMFGMPQNINIALERSIELVFQEESMLSTSTACSL
jgi:hypothetical protein